MEFTIPASKNNVLLIIYRFFKRRERELAHNWGNPRPNQEIKRSYEKDERINICPLIRTLFVTGPYHLALWLLEYAILPATLAIMFTFVALAFLIVAGYGVYEASGLARGIDWMSVFSAIGITIGGAVALVLFLRYPGLWIAMGLLLLIVAVATFVGRVFEFLFPRRKAKEEDRSGRKVFPIIEAWFKGLEEKTCFSIKIV